MKFKQTRSLLPRYVLCGITLACAAPLACANSAATGPRTVAPEVTKTHVAKEHEEEPLVAPVDTNEVTSASDSTRGASSPDAIERSSDARPDASRTPVVAATHPGSEPLIPPIDYVKGPVSAAAAPSDGAAEREGGMGIGLSGVGEGGGGVGEMRGLGLGAGTGTGAGWGAGHGRLGGGHKAASGAVGVAPGAADGDQRRSGVGAGEWDDNANFLEFKKFLSTQKDVPFTKVNVERRRFVVVQDGKGQGVPNCTVTVRDGSGHATRLTTGASGRVVLFPRADGLVGKSLNATASCLGGEVSAKIDLAQNDGVVSLKLGGDRALPAVRTVDVAFVLDTTGSMSEEINQLKSTIMKVADTLGEAGVRVRLGMVEYRDRGDIFLTRVHQMTTDVNGFVGRVEAVRA